MDLVIPLDIKGVGRGEVKFLGGDSLQIDVQDWAVISVDQWLVHHIDQWFEQGPFLDGAHVDTIDVIPEADLVSLVILVLNGAEPDDCTVGVHMTIFLEPLVTGVEDGVKHGLIKQEISHPFGDNDVDLVDGEGYFFDLALDDGNGLAEAVFLDDFAGLGN